MGDAAYQPLAGDPDTLESEAIHYGDIANAITRSVNTLRKVHGVEGMTSKAVDAIKDSSGKVAEDIHKAQERYAITAKALLAYSSALRQAQDDARAALAQIDSKQDEATLAHRRASAARQKADSSLEADASVDKAESTKADESASEANRDLEAAHNLWHEAAADKSSAADAAIRLISDVVNGPKNHGLKDSWWDNVGAKLYSALKTICKWAGVLAIFLAWVPVLGEILMVLAAVGAILDLIESLVNVIAGNGSWGDVLMASVGVVLTFAGGALLAHLGKLGKSALVVKATSKIVHNPAMKGELRGILKLKDGESIAPSLISAGKQMQMGLKDVLKEPFKALVPRSLIHNASEFTRENMIRMLKEAGPGNVIKNGLKVNDDTLQAIKLAVMNPAALRDPITFARVAIPVAIQGVQTGRAVATIVGDPSSFISSPANYLGGPVVEAVKSTIGTVDRIWG